MPTGALPDDDGTDNISPRLGLLEPVRRCGFGVASDGHFEFGLRQDPTSCSAVRLFLLDYGPAGGRGKRDARNSRACVGISRDRDGDRLSRSDHFVVSQTIDNHALGLCERVREVRFLELKQEVGLCSLSRAGVESGQGRPYLAELLQTRALSRGLRTRTTAAGISRAPRQQRSARPTTVLSTATRALPA